MMNPAQNTGSLFGGVTFTKNSFESPLGKDAFLNMFLTQLKHQDPTNPMESHELAAQLAQFTTVERLSEINKNVVEQLSSLTSINYSQMAQMVGQEVVGQDGGIQLYDGRTSASSYDLPVTARVAVKIFNDNGTLVRTLNLGSQAAGNHLVEWDGKNEAGQALGQGRYHAHIEAVDETGNFIQVGQRVSGTVHAFRLVENQPYLVLDHEKGLLLPIASVRQVSAGRG